MEKHTTKILITAGPTREDIDPVRFISNRSTGVMGYNIAREALVRKHKVVLISGPVCIKPPKGAKIVMVETAEQMRKAVVREALTSDCLIMAAAVSDFRPVNKHSDKIKKKKKLVIRLEKTEDILKAVKKRKGLIKIGFALETDALVKNAAKKLKNKKLDLIVANKRTKKDDPFGEGKKDFLVINKKGETYKIKSAAKRKMASVIMEHAEKLLEGNACL